MLGLSKRTRIWMVAFPLAAGLLRCACAAAPWTLEAALACAWTNSPDARIAQTRVAAARAASRQAEASLWPQLQFEAGYFRSDNPVNVFAYTLQHRAFTSALNFNDAPDADNLNLRGVLAAPLYAGGSLRASRDAARASHAAARFEAAAVRNTLSFEVARAFFVTLKTRQLIAAATAAVRAFEGHVDTAQARLRSGTLLKSDLLDLEVRLAQAREDLVSSRHAHALAQKALATLLGLENTPFEASEQAPALQLPTPSSTPPARPELEAAREYESAAQAGVRRARGGYAPRVEAFGSLQYDRGWRPEGDDASYTAGVLAQWTLWDGHRTDGKVAQARAEHEAAVEQSRKLRLAIEFEIEQATRDLDAAKERLPVAAKAVEQASESVDLIRSRFQQGLSLHTQLMDAEAALIAARVRRTQAETDRRIAVAALRKALGLPQIESPNTR